jgi:periplasmic divalent cation tolerance protein
MTVVFCYVTCPGPEQARQIADALVAERLAACGNILRGMRSVYRWRGAVHEAAEVVLILKTRRALSERVVARVKALHPYECPCVAVLSVEGGNPDYLAWIMAETDDSA